MVHLKFKKKTFTTEGPEFDCELGKVTLSCSGSLFSQFCQQNMLPEHIFYYLISYCTLSIKRFFYLHHSSFMMNSLSLWRLFRCQKLLLNFSWVFYVYLFRLVEEFQWKFKVRILVDENMGVPGTTGHASGTFLTFNYIEITEHIYITSWTFTKMMTMVMIMVISFKEMEHLNIHSLSNTL